MENSLKITDDITEQNRSLAVDAFIEAVRPDSTAKSFREVVNETSKLSSQSRDSLQSSGVQIKGRNTNLIISSPLAEDIHKWFTSIQHTSSQSSMDTPKMAELIERQKNQSNGILKALNGLMEETFLIQDLAHKKKEHTRFVHKSLSKLLKIFLSITSSPKAPSREGQHLNTFLKDLGKVLNENLDNVNVLENLIQEGQKKINGNRKQMDQPPNPLRRFPQNIKTNAS